MKVLLINPPTHKIVTTTQPSFIVQNRGLVPPLGLVYLASAVQERRVGKVKILDCQLDQLADDAIKQQILDYQPDVVGITMVTFVLPDSLNIAALVNQCEHILQKRILVIAGGPHTFIFPEETARLPHIDFVLSGEAEFTFPTLLENIGNHEALTEIPGLWYMREDELVKGPPYSYINDLDSIPLPDRTLLDYQRYSNVLAGRGFMTTMMTSRGCPYQCIFCDRLGKRFRAASAEYVVREIEACLRLNINEIFFHDDTFTVNKKRVLEICRLISEQALHFTFSLRSRVNTIDEEMIKALREVGCRRISFGVESGVQRIIDRIKKGITLEQAEQAFRLARKYRITTLADFMIGHPDETIEDIHATLRFAKKLRPDYAQFSITTPYPGTELYWEALERKIIPSDVWREFASNPRADFSPPRWEGEIPREALHQLGHQCYRKFYFAPSYILRQMLTIRNVAEFQKKFQAGSQLLLNQALRQLGVKNDGFK